MENINKIICIDALEGINSLPDNSINLIITSPPYFNCRVYGNETIGREENPLDYINNIFNKSSLDYPTFRDNLVSYIAFNRDVPILNKEKSIDDILKELELDIPNLVIKIKNSL